ncbi:MAG: adenylate/guanylate cyclase domain-containing protein [Bacteroidales bacterium]
MRKHSSALTPKINKNIPKYTTVRMFIIPILLFFVLTGPSTSFILLKNITLWNKEYNTKATVAKDTLKLKPLSKDSLLQLNINGLEDSLNNITNKTDSAKKGGFTISLNPKNEDDFKLNDTTDDVLTWYGLLFIIIAGFAINLPFKIYFWRLRRNKTISKKLKSYCRRWLLKTPFFISGLFSIYFLINTLYSMYRLLWDTSFTNEVSRKIYTQLFPVSIVASVLVIIFVYFWQKHRVHIKYIEYIFTKEELKKRVFNLKIGRIKNRLWISSAMTTLLPLIIVLFYMLMSLSSIKELGEINIDKAKVLLGSYYKDKADFNISSFSDNFNGFFYVNAINSMMMMIGIGVGMLVSLIYIIVFVKWTTQDIVQPVKELLKNMKETGEGKMDQYAIVRTNDEIGQLTEGYNDMSLKIKNYINNITHINQANSQFVPRQFLEFLQKKDITDIKKGDQVQREMSVLFADIRSFTSLSEKMTPKENFDFINSYLEYMEPAINSNEGFIDKYIGDAIMALFGCSADDAVKAALDMRLQLMQFNKVLKEEGKSPVEIGIGIHTGNLMLGIVGGSERLQGTVISNAVNLASRIESLTKMYGIPIIISDSTLSCLVNKDHFSYRYIDNVRVIGKKEAVILYEVLDVKSNPNLCYKIIETLPDYQKAIDLYREKSFTEAAIIFSHLNQICINDPIISMYKERSEHFNLKGVPDGWDGVEVIREK